MKSIIAIVLIAVGLIAENISAQSYNTLLVIAMTSHALSIGLLCLPSKGVSPIWRGVGIGIASRSLFSVLLRFL